MGRLVYSATDASNLIYYTRKFGYFLQVLDFEPKIYDGSGLLRKPSELKVLSFQSYEASKISLAGLNSTLFYWFCMVFSDCRNLNKREVDAFPIVFNALGKSVDQTRVIELCVALMENLKATSEDRIMRFAHDTLTVQCIIPKHSKPIIDEIDKVLAQHYGFTDEELDFIINYDIKYRMGRDAGEEEA